MQATAVYIVPSVEDKSPHISLYHMGLVDAPPFLSTKQPVIERKNTCRMNIKNAFPT